MVVAVVVGLVSYFGMRSTKSPQPERTVSRIATSSVELTASNGTVLLRKPGWADWQPVKVGMRLTEGDLLQVSSNAEAIIRYPDGSTLPVQSSTIATIQNIRNGPKAIGITTVPSTSENSAETAAAPGEIVLEGEPPSEEKAGESLPTVVLQRIIRFGRSLELIGQVEAGSDLVVNGEPVDVTGDGSFKHFTSPFPATAGKIRLALKVTNLAGRSRILATTYDFGPHSGDN